MGTPHGRRQTTTTTSAREKGDATHTPRADATKKAKQAAAKTLSTGKKRVTKVRTSTRFYRPTTLALPRTPKFPRKSTPSAPLLDKWSIIKAPLTSEAAMNKIEKHNTLVFLVDTRANKRQIKNAAAERFSVKVAKVNTLIRPDGQKKAFIKLTSEHDALDVASKIGVV